MDPLTEAKKKLMPEMTELLKKRYQILQTIGLEQPIGRRTLSELAGMTERDIRKETDLLRNQQLIEARTSGMYVSVQGEEVLEALKDFMREMAGLSDMEKQLKSILGITRVLILPQDSDDIPAVKANIGKEAARLLETKFPLYKKIAVTGGSTMAAISKEITADKKDASLQFIAARGGLGEDVLHQANTIASLFAEKTGGAVKTLYLPDHLSAEAYEMMMREPVIKEMMELYDQTEVVVHGIGNAEEIALHRKSSVEEVNRIRNGGAVSEAFGYYFDKEGNVVYRIRTAGIQMEQVQNAPFILAVGGGRSKATAILSYFKIAPPQTTLITDEGAARKIIELTQKQEEF
ncbi:central glycolytic genes regulator [Planococcus glaciei]|uniref:sugar-binding transcriptional regulator n=1 Tax=Planococcus glaciei TaxID=459472 RepID=UPI00088656E9|nr:sugar-binding domain-containing protein [Planococcus glaciei]SDH63323.1 central glycolytic genes regulator [Planococcus glaciei]